MRGVPVEHCTAKDAAQCHVALHSQPSAPECNMELHNTTPIHTALHKVELQHGTTKCNIGNAMNLSAIQQYVVLQSATPCNASQIPTKQCSVQKIHNVTQYSSYHPQSNKAVILLSCTEAAASQPQGSIPCAVSLGCCYPNASPQKQLHRSSG